MLRPTLCTVSFLSRSWRPTGCTFVFGPDNETPARERQRLEKHKTKCVLRVERERWELNGELLGDVRILQGHPSCHLPSLLRGSKGAAIYQAVNVSLGALFLWLYTHTHTHTKKSCECECVRRVGRPIHLVRHSMQGKNTKCAPVQTYR